MEFDVLTGLAAITGTVQALRRTLIQPKRERKGPITGLFYGRYWARTSDPQLVDLVRPFAPVRSGALKEHG
jgi:hypothetical protein